LTSMDESSSSSLSSGKRTKKLSSEGRGKAKRKALEEIEPLVRKSARVRERHNRTVRATLTFASEYVGVAQQHLSAVEALYFRQTATLTMPGGAPYAITSYYALRQEVRDSYTRIGDESQAPTEWAQDGPYQPDYGADEDEGQMTVTATSIVFRDEPGFSGTGGGEADRRIVADAWLANYDVHFRWTVTAVGSHEVWTSPEVHHSLTSAHTADEAVALVVHAAGGNITWEVVLPDRPDV